MLNSEHSRKQILDTCVSIMLKYPHLFPIVETINKCYQEHDKKDFMISYEIEQHTGLKYIIAQKINHVQEIWWETSPNNYTSLVNSIIKSILIIYTRITIFPSDVDEWKEMITNENLKC